MVAIDEQRAFRPYERDGLLKEAPRAEFRFSAFAEQYLATLPVPTPLFVRY